MQKYTTIPEIAAQLHKIWRADIGEDMAGLINLFNAHLSFKGCSFKYEVEEGSEADAYVLRANCDVEEAFYEHMNSVKAYESLSYFTGICEMYLDGAAQAKPSKGLADIAEAHARTFQTIQRILSQHKAA